MSDQQIGKLWWSAESHKEALQWAADAMASGAFEVSLKPLAGYPQVDVIITCDKAIADEVAGYTVEESEWMEE